MIREAIGRMRLKVISVEFAYSPGENGRAASPRLQQCIGFCLGFSAASAMPPYRTTRPEPPLFKRASTSARVEKLKSP